MKPRKEATPVAQRKAAAARLRAFPTLWHTWQAQRAATDPTIWAIRTPVEMTQVLASRWRMAGANELLTVHELLTVAGAVAALPPVAQEVIRWHDWEHLSVQVVAERLYLSRSGLYHVHDRACDQLARWWQAKPPHARTQAVKSAVDRWF